MIVIPTTDRRRRHVDADALRLVADLQRYGGWLDKDYVSGLVRGDLRDLAAAVQSGGDTVVCLQRLDEDLQRLQSGGVRTMLRRAVQALQTVLEATIIDEEIGI